jgi:uncharacterized protein
MEYKAYSDIIGRNEKTHELRKQYINIEDSFEKTLSVIRKLINKEIDIAIRLNFDKDNFDDIIKLIYYIKSEFSSNKYLKVYAYPLYKSEQYDNMSYISPKESDFYLDQINNVLLKNEYLKLKDMFPKRKKGCCSATSPNSFVINTNGDLYKCSMDMKDNSRSIGNVKKGITNQNVFIEWCMPVLPEKCNDCIALPLCQGGCRANRILHIDDNYCFVKQHSIKYYVANINSSLSKEGKYDTH